jgi:hypothetical protein
MSLDIISFPTYNVNTLAIVDNSNYTIDIEDITNPTIEIVPPGYPLVVINFKVNDYNLFSSDNLLITLPGVKQSLPDGLYKLKYSIYPADVNFVEKTVFRVEKLQEKFYKAFLTLEGLSCDMAIKKQAKDSLDRIHIFINGAIAAGNECASIEAYALYKKADKMLDKLLNNNCGCN